MKFCPQCGATMSKNVTLNSTIVFICTCQYIVDGDEQDTLMFEEYAEAAMNNTVQGIFIENSPYDLARNVVMKDCPKCKLDHLTMIQVGANETTMYTCDCGFTATHAEYNALKQAST